MNLKKIVWGESILIRVYVDQISLNGGILVFVEVELWPYSFLIPTKIFWSNINMTKLYNICEFKENRIGGKYFNKRICRSDKLKRRYIGLRWSWTLTLFPSHSHQKYFGRMMIWISYIIYVNLKQIVWGESIFIRGYVDQICTNGGILVFVEVELWPCSFLIPTKIFWSKDNMTKLYNICEFKENRIGVKYFIRGYVDQICVNGGILVLNIIELWPCSFLTPTKIFWSNINTTKLYNICEFEENRIGGKYFYKRICRLLICVNGGILVLDLKLNFDLVPFSLPPKYFGQILIWLSYITYVNLKKIVWGESIFNKRICRLRICIKRRYIGPRWSWTLTSLLSNSQQNILIEY